MKGYVCEDAPRGFTHEQRQQREDLINAGFRPILANTAVILLSAPRITHADIGAILFLSASASLKRVNLLYQELNVAGSRFDGGQVWTKRDRAVESLQHMIARARAGEETP